MNLERVGRLLLALAVSLGLIGMALADDRAQFGRYLGLSGCLIMVALAVLLLAPRPAAQVERRTGSARRSSDRANAASHRVPRQRVPAPPRPAMSAEPRATAMSAEPRGTAMPGAVQRAAVDADPAGDVAAPRGSTRAA
jgi:predicted lipid-binding transport protein (Tim44 family)